MSILSQIRKISNSNAEKTEKSALALLILPDKFKRLDVQVIFKSII